MQRQLQRYLRTRGRPGARVSQVATIAAGLESVIHRFRLQDGADDRTWVLRRFNPDGFSTNPSREFRVMQHLGAADFPVPAVLVHERDPAPLGGPFLVMAYVPGPTLLAHLSNLSAADDADALDAFAQLLVRLHRMDWRPLVGPDTVWATVAESQTPQDRELLARVVAGTWMEPVFAPAFSWLEQRAARMAPLGRAVVHGDFHPGNLLLADDQFPVVIDWSYAGVGDPRADLANTLLIFELLGSPHRAAVVRAAYERAARTALTDGSPLVDFDYFVAISYTRRLIDAARLITDASGALRSFAPAERASLQQFVRSMYTGLQTQTGVALPFVEGFLSAN